MQTAAARKPLKAQPECLHFLYKACGTFQLICVEHDASSAGSCSFTADMDSYGAACTRKMHNVSAVGIPDLCNILKIGKTKFPWAPAVPTIPTDQEKHESRGYRMAGEYPRNVKYVEYVGITDSVDTHVISKGGIAWVNTVEDIPTKIKEYEKRG